MFEHPEWLIIGERYLSYDFLIDPNFRHLRVYNTIAPIECLARYISECLDVVVLFLGHSFLETCLSHFFYEFFSAMAIYLSRLHDYHSIDIYSIKKMKIMRNNNDQLRHTSPLVDLLRQDVYSTDIETRVDLIEDDDPRIEERYLEHLDTALLPS